MLSVGEAHAGCASGSRGVGRSGRRRGPAVVASVGRDDRPDDDRDDEAATDPGVEHGDRQDDGERSGGTRVADGEANQHHEQQDDECPHALLRRIIVA